MPRCSAATIPADKELYQRQTRHELGRTLVERSRPPTGRLTPWCMNCGEILSGTTQSCHQVRSSPQFRSLYNWMSGNTGGIKHGEKIDRSLHCRRP